MGKAVLASTCIFPAVSLQHLPTHLASAAVPLLDPDSSIIHTLFQVKGGAKRWVFFIHWFSPFFFFFKSFSLQSNMKNMEQELCCPVCDGMVKQPILLPCQHSVCLLCAAEVLLQRGYPPPDLPPEPQSPASTPNSRSPRQARRPTPRTPDRLERVLRTGVFVTLVKKQEEYLLVCKKK